MRADRCVGRVAVAAVMVAVAAVVLAACGNDNRTDTAVELSGLVADDGYLSGVKVCVDADGDGVCGAGEPSAVTASGGAYSIAGVPSTTASASALVAEVPAGAIDSATGNIEGQAFTLSAPPASSFVSALSTLVNEKVRAGNNLVQAKAGVTASLGITTATFDLASDYVASSAGGADQTNDYIRAREAAKVLANGLKVGKALSGSASASTDQGTQDVLLQEAERALLVQASGTSKATLFNAAFVNTSSFASTSTLKTAVAANKLSRASATQAVTINFDVVNGSTPVGTSGCTTPLSLGSPAVSGTIKDLRFYVSYISLIDASGGYAPVLLTENDYQGRNVALLDFEDSAGTCSGNSSPGTHTAVTGTVKPGTYTGIAFSLGVPVLSADGGPKVPLNHSSYTQAWPNGDVPATPAPLLNSAMSWSWQSGRKFTKIEFTATAGAVTTAVHLGSTGCVGDPTVGLITNCSSPNRPNVVFETGFDVTSNKIVLDIGELFGGLDLSSSKTWMSATGTAGSTAAYFFDRFQLGLAGVTTPYEPGLPLNDGVNQTLFRIE